jgi:hypothetical protein
MKFRHILLTMLAALTLLMASTGYAQTKTAPTTPANGPNQKATALVDINSASIDQLKALPASAMPTPRRSWMAVHTPTKPN